jgi:hypothetical protein
MSMTKYTLIAAVALCVAFNARALAQGSPYNFIGFGEPVASANPRTEGLAGAGVALTEPRTVSDLNPALWSWIAKTRFEARLNLTTSQSEFGPSTGLLHVVKLGGFAFGAMLNERNGIGLGLGMAPVTHADAEAKVTDSIGTTTYKREGGVSQLYAGLSARLASGIALGARFDYLFGNLRQLAQAMPTDPEATAGIFDREYSLSGLRGTFGLAISLDSFVSGLHGLTFGASYSTQGALHSTRRNIFTPTNAALDTTIDTPGDAIFPAEMKLGISGRFGDRYRAEGSFSTSDYSVASFFSTADPIPGDPQLGTYQRIAIGIERLPRMGDEGKGISAVERAGIRAGFAITTLPFLPDRRTNVTETSASIGFSLPINLESLLEFSFTGGIREPELASVGPKDTFLRISGSISLGERWFAPLRREDDE